jgi:hypothetical protein
MTGSQIHKQKIKLENNFIHKCIAHLQRYFHNYKNIRTFYNINTKIL